MSKASAFKDRCDEVFKTRPKIHLGKFICRVDEYGDFALDPQEDGRLTLSPTEALKWRDWITDNFDE